MRSSEAASDKRAAVALGGHAERRAPVPEVGGAVAGAASRAAPPTDAPRWWRDALRRRVLALADALAAAIGTAAAGLSVAEAPWALVFLPLWLVLAKLVGLYDRDHQAIRHLTIDEVPLILAWAAAGTASLALLLPLTPAGSLDATGAAGMFVGAALTAFAARGAARSLWRRVTPPERTAVIGDGELAEAIARKAELFKDMHLRVVRGREGLADRELSAEDLDRATSGVDRIVVASASVDPDLIARLVVLCRVHQIKLSVVSPLRGRALPLLRITQVADLPVFDYDTWDVSRSTRMLKRGFDVMVSGAALIALAPLFPLVALAIRLDSRGPVIFSQLRAGAGGRPFRMHKLRTMTANAEESLSEIVRLDELREPMFKLRNDPRVTRVGRLLRRFSLDELPQLVNVLRGEMSVVGPRPEQVELVERYEPEHRFRLAVKPGMTGPMQVFGRGELTFAERLAVELDYVENMSIGRDLRLLFQTVPAIVRGTGAF
ncbi:MAG TPA: sugar transferase [Solirubrobacterales bacterium]|nr:sugar transferase [Solirubrobacterales bacterium]